MKIYLCIILIIAFFVRFINLESVPPGLGWDEVSHGYNAYSILKTGHDEWGQFLPIANFRAYGDYPLPLYMYIMMPFISLFGLNEFAIRFPSALLGSLTILIIYLLSKEIFKNEKTALLSAFLLALSPWGILPSRQVIQSTPAIFFLSLGFWLLIKSISSRGLYSVLGAISLGLSAYAYHNTRILAPLLLIFFAFLFKDKIFINVKKYVLSFLIICIFFIPLIPIIFSSEGSARANWVSIIDQGAINYLNESRTFSTLPDPLPRLIFNRPVYFISKFSLNYLGYFNPLYLGFEGGTHYQFSIPHFGIVYPVELPFFYIGLIILIFNVIKLDNNKRFILGWLILAPLPAAVTRDPYQVIRAFAMITPYYLIVGYGLVVVFDYLKDKFKISQKLLISIFLLSIIVLSLFYLQNLYFIYPKKYSFAWQYGYKEAVQYIQDNSSKYSRVVITKRYGEPHEFLLFYSKYDPKSYQTDPNLIRYEKSQWFWVDRFNKFEFINDWEIKEKMIGATNTLLVTSPGNYPLGSRIVKSIYFLNGDKAFDIVAID
ncbi:MAG: glycosyltransferase family 39 protein [Candidatus Daviesbacteria bacterium]|nr:glycosyltransferase family 39 protein [Candidatus Daviesbacteria bacterium]